MNQKELKELIEFLIEKDITEFEMERGDVKLRIKRGAEPVAIAAPLPYPAAHSVYSAPAAPVEPAAGQASASDGVGASESVAASAPVHIVRSPIVGTYYESPSPGSPPFIKVGDTIEVGQILCIVEAMKLMNEIEADVGGEIVKMLVANGQPIEYGQELFHINPKV